MKELIIHIGLSKTGSSAVQSWLSLNAKALKANGFDYADIIPGAKEGRITSGNGKPLYEACQNTDWLEVERLILNVYFGRNNNAIISSEWLQAIDPFAIRKVKEICERNNILVHIVAYVRSVYEMLYSGYLQRIKRGGATYKFGEVEPLQYKVQRGYLENYFNVFADKFKVLNYDSCKNDLCGSFSQLLGMRDSDFITENKKVNRSLTFAESKVLRVMNKLHEGVFSVEISDYLIYLSPERPTMVFYDENLLRKTSENSKHDVDWINNNLICGDDFIALNNFDGSVATDGSVAADVISDIVKWALNRAVDTKASAVINFLYRLAVHLEAHRMNDAFLLMRRAHFLRPAGPAIQNKLIIYAENLAVEI